MKKGDYKNDMGNKSARREKMMYGGMNNKRKKKMYGGSMGRKKAMHGGPHNNMDRMGMAMGGAMKVQKPN